MHSIGIILFFVCFNFAFSAQRPDDLITLPLSLRPRLETLSTASTVVLPLSSYHSNMQLKKTLDQEIDWDQIITLKDCLNVISSLDDKPKSKASSLQNLPEASVQIVSFFEEHKVRLRVHALGKFNQKLSILLSDKSYKERGLLILILGKIFSRLEKTLVKSITMTLKENNLIPELTNLDKRFKAFFLPRVNFFIDEVAKTMPALDETILQEIWERVPDPELAFRSWLSGIVPKLQTKTLSLLQSSAYSMGEIYLLAWITLYLDKIFNIDDFDCEKSNELSKFNLEAIQTIFREFFEEDAGSENPYKTTIKVLIKPISLDTFCKRQKVLEI